MPVRLGVWHAGCLFGADGNNMKIKTNVKAGGKYLVIKMESVIITQVGSSS